MHISTYDIYLINEMVIMSTTSIPKKYLLVKKYIIDKINCGEFLPNEKIPSESELSKLLDVSNITVRKALSDLVNENMIYREKGKGSFVSDDAGKKSSNHLVCIILATQDFNDSSHLAIIRGAQNRLAENGYALIVEWACDDIQAQHKVVQNLIERKVDGLLIYPFEPDNELELYSKIEQNGLPYVLLDRYTNKHQSCFVGCNNYGGTYEATNYLLGQKHTKIQFISYNIHLSSEQERFHGFCDAMQEAGLQIDPNNYLIEKDLDYKRLVESIRRHEITALFCCNDKIAIKMMNQLLALGVQIPNDVSVMGFDDETIVQTAPVGLSTVKQSFETLGSYGADLLLRHINTDNDFNNTQIFIGTKLVLRDSIIKNTWL